MSERRVSGWFVMSAVFLVAVFGLFFTFTDRKTWPEEKVELTATDMRLFPPTSTVWCEAVALYSDHPFVAYQLNEGDNINSKKLSRQQINMQVRLGTSQRSNSLKLKYFLLSSSVVEIVACSSTSGALMMIFQGEKDISSCLQRLSVGFDDSYANDSDSDESSSEEINEEVLQLYGNKFCSSVFFKYHPIEASYIDGTTVMCSPSIQTSPFKINISASDYYVIAVLNTNQFLPNEISIQLHLDRSRYTVHSSGQAFDMCSLSTSCTIGLGFATKDRVLVWIPEETNAGRKSFVIRSRCKPRLAVFAILSVFVPLILFLVVAFVVRADSNRIKNKLYRRPIPQVQLTRLSAPLLETTSPSSTPCIEQSSGNEEIRISRHPRQEEELPPPYHTLYEPPPPYSGLKREVAK